MYKFYVAGGYHHVRMWQKFCSMAEAEQPGINWQECAINKLTDYNAKYYGSNAGYTRHGEWHIEFATEEDFLAFKLKYS